MLTGSANVLLVPRLDDSLAGRMGLLRLHPSAQCEITGARPRFIEAASTGHFKTGMTERLGPGLAERIVAGGYPAALVRRSASRRGAWYRDYVETQIQRDVRDLARVHALDRDRTAIGSLLETFVPQELRRQASGRPSPVDFFHFRDRDDFEVDIVMERGHAAVAGVEVKAAATVADHDFRGLRKLRAAAGSRFTAGVVLYDGTATIQFDHGLFGVPLPGPQDPRRCDFPAE